MRRLLLPLAPLLTLLIAALVVPAFAEEAPGPTPSTPPQRSKALIKTSMGDITVELFDDQTPLTVANFLGLADGTKAWKDQGGATQRRPFFDGLGFHRVIDGFMLQGGCPRGDGTGDAGYKFEDEINADSLGLGKMRAFNAGRPHPWLLIRSQQEFNRFRQQISGPFLRSRGITTQEQLQAQQKELDKAFAALTLKEVYELQGYVFKTGEATSKPEAGSLAMANSGPATNGSQFFINIEPTPHLTGKHTVFGRVIAGMDVVKKIGKVRVNPATSKPVEPVRIISIREIR